MGPGTGMWGPPLWSLFHTLAERIDENAFPRIGKDLFHMIKRICSHLPCPDCAQHATQFLSKVNIGKINKKEDLKNLLFHFHNVVNKRKNKSLFPYEQIAEEYKNRNLNATIQRFFQVYKTKGNMKLLTETFQRQLVLKDFSQWIKENYAYFVRKPI
jgi:hypothetical protein